MKYFSHTTKKGFTLVELLVVISIVGFLAAALMAPFNRATMLARDAQRKASLDSVRTALQLYHNRYGTYLVAGTGYDGTGEGYMSFEDGNNYTKSATRGLYEEGLLNAPSLDLAGDSPNMMIYLCNPDTYAVFVTLENPSSDDLTKAQNLCDGGVATGATFEKNFGLSN